jgi:hypothetical protein
MTLSSKYSEYCANPNCGRFLATYTSRKRGLCAICDITAYREVGEKGDKIIYGLDRKRKGTDWAKR